MSVVRMSEKAGQRSAVVTQAAAKRRAEVLARARGSSPGAGGTAASGGGRWERKCFGCHHHLSTEGPPSDPHSHPPTSPSPVHPGTQQAPAPHGQHCERGVLQQRTHTGSVWWLGSARAAALSAVSPTSHSLPHSVFMESREKWGQAVFAHDLPARDSRSSGTSVPICRSCDRMILSTSSMICLLCGPESKTGSPSRESSSLSHYSLVWTEKVCP